MRELTLPEVQRVAGGFGFEDETSTQDTVVVTADRIRREYDYIGNMNGFGMYRGAGDTVYFIPGAGEGGQPQDADDSADENTAADPWETFYDLFPGMPPNYEDWPIEPNPDSWPIDQIPGLNP